MAFKQIISRRHQERSEPYVSVGSYGLIFNQAAVNMVGPENVRTVVFYDKDKRRLAFTFFKAVLSGSYAFAVQTKFTKRRVALATFLKANRVFDGVTQTDFPLELLDEQIPDYEGSEVFVINLY